jgi:hypothetical protein
MPRFDDCRDPGGSCDVQQDSFTREALGEQSCLLEVPICARCNLLPMPLTLLSFDKCNPPSCPGNTQGLILLTSPQSCISLVQAPVSSGRRPMKLSLMSLHLKSTPPGCHEKCRKDISMPCL